MYVCAGGTCRKTISKTLRISLCVHSVSLICMRLYAHYNAACTIIFVHNLSSMAGLAAVVGVIRIVA